MRYILGAIFLMTLGCQHSPTKVVNQQEAISSTSTSAKLLKDQPVILDVRPAFEFNLSHTPGAINVRWEDFSQSHPQSRGLLQKDLFALARRLSLIGIDPTTKVLVLGKGREGAGEEGRVAWSLKVLGIKEVYTVLHSTFREMNTVKEVPLPRNKAYWKPQKVDNLEIDLNTFKKILSQDTATIILDVRSPEEFALRNLSHMKSVKASVINTPWNQFFDEQGLPKAQDQIPKEAQIFVISNHGVRSGAVTYALDFLGYKNVSNFSGGYEQWK